MQAAEPAAQIVGKNTEELMRSYPEYTLSLELIL
jgi:hypothetical protein